ncbi:MAG: hypothetical protein H6577_01080 [Lewinellaceae bacterium]|nr:hypothetical protein [Saprospiraceae bacterium]MCB9336697.1 hypothetical protein [Lewinellaceae bacterium]
MKHLIGCLLVGCVAFICSVNAQDNNQLIIFLQHGRSISEDFKRNALPGIQQYAQREKLEVKILDAREGAPEEVAFTPAIVFQNKIGHSLFQGRYRKIGQLEKFVADAKKAHTAEKADFQENTVVWNYGRATLAAPMKVMPLTGKVPSNFNQDDFTQKAYESLAAGMDYFKMGKDGDFSGPVRQFHMEFYPEKSKEGALLIQMKLFSQFDPNNPVFVSDIPSGGDWGDVDMVFKKAGNRLEKMLLAQISNWDNGDGFDSLSEKIPMKSWKDLGMVAKGPVKENELTSLSK